MLVWLDWTGNKRTHPPSISQIPHNKHRNMRDIIFLMKKNECVLHQTRFPPLLHLNGHTQPSIHQLPTQWPSPRHIKTIIRFHSEHSTHSLSFFLSSPFFSHIFERKHRNNPLPTSTPTTEQTMTIALKLYELVDGKTRAISFSPAVWRAKMALNYKGVTYESLPLTFLEIPTTIPKTW